ncbi:hypothetical protein MNEG_7148, partial [Monoraphidium neglectum]
APAPGGARAVRLALHPIDNGQGVQEAGGAGGRQSCGVGAGGAAGAAGGRGSRGRQVIKGRAPGCAGGS